MNCDKITTEWAMLSLICMHNKFRTSQIGDHQTDSRNDNFLLFLSSYQRQKLVSEGLSYEDILWEVLHTVWNRWWPEECYMDDIPAPSTDIDIPSIVEIINFLTELENSPQFTPSPSRSEEILPTNIEPVDENTNVTIIEKTPSTITIYGETRRWKRVSGTISRVLSRRNRGTSDTKLDSACPPYHMPKSSKYKLLNMSITGKNGKTDINHPRNIPLRCFGTETTNGQSRGNVMGEVKSIPDEVIGIQPKSRMKRRSIRDLWPAYSGTA